MASDDPFGNSELFAEFQRDSDEEMSEMPNPRHIRFDESDSEEDWDTPEPAVNGEKSSLKRKSCDENPDGVAKKRSLVDPDCCVQVLYNDKKFSSRNKNVIEDFILKLISANRDELSSNQNNSESVDYSNFYKDFLVDIRGSRTSESSVIAEGSHPVYDQVYRKALPCESESESEPDEDACPQTRNGGKAKSSCWNCGGGHSLHECKEKKDHSKIAINRAAFMANKDGGAQNSPDSRYHADDDPRFSVFKAGQISESLREALGITEGHVPPYIYNMRNHGYPPGHLIDASLGVSDISMFDKHGKEVAKDGQQMEDGEVDDQAAKGGYNYNKIIEYQGFNVLTDTDMDRGLNEFQLKTNLPKIFGGGVFRVIDGLERDSQGSSKVEDREDVDMDTAADGSPSKRIATPLSDGQCTESGESLEDLESEKRRILESLQAADTTEESTEAESTCPESSDAESIQLRNKLETPKNNRSKSLLVNLGTPLGVDSGNKIPEADKFRENITEHIPYENLPNATGMFTKMMNVMGKVRDTLTQLKK